MNKGYIALHRSLVEWEWYKDLPVRCLFIHLLLRANHKERSYKGKKIKRGQYLIGRETLAIESGLSVQQVRTALSKLKSTNEITIETTNGYHLINIENYCVYQQKEDKSNQRNNQRITNDQPTDNQRITTNNNGNNGNNGNNSTPVETPPIKTPPLTPPENFEGSFKQSLNKEELGVNCIMSQLDDKALAKAKANAPRWDIYHLAGIYAEGINDGTREAPKSVKAAFPAWCAKYTKGNPPQ